MRTIVVWFRNDLRVNDHPALAMAAKDGDRVVPLFILNEALLHGKHGSANRNRFLLESLQALQQRLRQHGSDLIVRNGDAATELTKLTAEVAADAVYYSADYTPYAIKRDKTVKAALAIDGVQFRGFPGRLIVSSLGALHTKAGTPHKVFTPFYKNWLEVERREVARLPDQLPKLPDSLTGDDLPLAATVTTTGELSPDALPGGETAGRERLQAFLDDGIADYKAASNGLALDGTSRLSSYLHFGCLSPLEIETMLPDNSGAVAWRRQLAWREFYHSIIFTFPTNAHQEYQERYRAMPWGHDPALLAAWQSGQTGYPVVDAGMRQLQREGWMHNRARLIVGSFLTKDLWLDWRHGEQHFMRWLIDGDEANNNGNWQWIASVGVDPAPVFRRLYNPTRQQQNFDPEGAYVRRYVPELKDVPKEYLAEPWTMPDDVQRASHCIIGKDYPAPVVDHAQARLAALERYRAAAATATDDQS